MSILDALSKHSMFSETLDTLNRDPSTGHQMKGYDFAQNFPGAVPGGINTPTSFLGPMLSKGYQYGQQIGNALLDGPGGYTLGQAIEDAKVQSDANIQGMLGKGFDMDTYNQNVKDFNINDVTFANSFGLDNLFGSSAMANELDEPIDVENFLEANRLKSTPDVVDVNRIPGRIQEAVEPQYRIRDQLRRDFLRAGLFRDAKQSLGQTKDAFLEDISGLTRGLGSITNKGMNLFGLAKDKGIDLGKMIGRGIGNAIFPGLGFLLGAVTDTPEQKVMRDFYKNRTGLDDIGRIQSGIMKGYNPVSMFGPQGVTSAIDKRLATILRTEEKKKKKGLKLSQELIDRRKKLEALKAQEETARINATKTMAQQNRDAGDRGGYQAGYGSDFMGGSGTSKDMGSS